MIRHTVPNSLQSEELSHYLKRAWPLLPGHVLRDTLKRKDVRIDGLKCGKGDMVRGGSVLEIYAPMRYFEAETEVIFNDGHLLAAVKPQGLPALPDQDGVGADTMETRLQRMYPSARLCHRLDAATGGVMLASLDEETFAQAFEAFKAHEIRKAYQAILCKKPICEEATLRAYLVKDAKRSIVRVTDSSVSGSKEIITRVKILGAAGEGLWMAELEPVTGRTHQLRAHMAHIGCPILGDDKYGNREINKQLGFVNRLCLWCETMEIPEGSPLCAHVGEKFHAAAPDWLKK